MDKSHWGAFEEHISGPEMARYNFAQNWLKFHWFGDNPRVIDAACGIGFGSAVLSAITSRVLGVDNDPEAIQYGEKHWARGGVELQCGDIFEIKREGDVVVSFNTLNDCVDPGTLLRSFNGIAPWLIASVPAGHSDTADMIRDAGYDIRERWSQHEDRSGKPKPDLNGHTFIYVARRHPERQAHENA